MRFAAAFIVLALVAGAGCVPVGERTELVSAARPAPAIDAKVPAELETATFGLG